MGMSVERMDQLQIQNRLHAVREDYAALQDLFREVYQAHFSPPPTVVQLAQWKSKFEYLTDGEL